MIEDLKSPKTSRVSFDNLKSNLAITPVGSGLAPPQFQLYNTGGTHKFVNPDTKTRIVNPADRKWVDPSIWNHSSQGRFVIRSGFPNCFSLSIPTR